MTHTQNGHHHTAQETHELAQARADRLGETIRLAFAIADDHARSDIEVYCKCLPFGQLDWYDTGAIDGDAPEVRKGIDDALRYLLLRGLVVLHPVQARLVRFARCNV